MKKERRDTWEHNLVEDMNLGDVDRARHWSNWKDWGTDPTEKRSSFSSLSLSLSLFFSVLFLLSSLSLLCSLFFHSLIWLEILFFFSLSFSNLLNLSEVAPPKPKTVTRISSGFSFFSLFF